MSLRSKVIFTNAASHSHLSRYLHNYSVIRQGEKMQLNFTRPLATRGNFLFSTWLASHINTLSLCVENVKRLSDFDPRQLLRTSLVRPPRHLRRVLLSWRMHQLQAHTIPGGSGDASRTRTLFPTYHFILPELYLPISKVISSARAFSARRNWLIHNHAALPLFLAPELAPR